MDLVTLRSVEGAAEVFELEVVWQVNDSTAVTAVLCEVPCAVVCVRVSVATASELFVVVEQLRHASIVRFVSIRAAISRDAVVVGERIHASDVTCSART